MLSFFFWPLCNEVNKTEDMRVFKVVDCVDATQSSIKPLITALCNIYFLKTKKL